ncbi:zinc-dependent metalloprotease [Mucilaginibacter sp. SG564]|uniref:zinc-dependent metalloprotease n=1 Tax=Mucilaginibacter sp. SG564 TaxID=2587022 RepID=UPI0015548645|nr:zinc-dependent metalloprotease [Mucilaginibacter sp. SG564]NOW96054.1 hypothetical protein [Mucilaginibacter sp. SG564]
MNKYILFWLLFFAITATSAQTAKKFRPFNSVITEDAIASKGLFNTYQVRDSVFIEIPDSLLKRPIMAINEFVKSAVRATDKGTLLSPSKLPEENLNSVTFYFESFRSENILARHSQDNILADVNSKIRKAVKRANDDEILQTMKIVARSENQSAYLVDATDFINNTTLFASAPGTAKHIDYVRSYPTNVDFGIERVLAQDPFLGGSDEVIVNTSFIALPKIPMRARIFDSRVGFFKPLTNVKTIYADNQQGSATVKYIDRWRMEPKPEDRERYLRGELVEPSKPIIIYIDPYTPKKWVKYLIMGINDWQAAFRQAGFKNAIRAEEWPKDRLADLHDARYSFLCYLPSSTPNAYGPHISDPRTGEIIQTHIGWFHSVQVILDGWYKSQAGALDSNARKLKFDDELMGQLIRFVSSHEVGHTLGLAHNFISSSETPVEKMRDKAYLKVHGHTSSIMDYARFNFVAQPEDSIPKENLWPHIGEYDRWAIQWGYKYLATNDIEKDRLIMSKLASDSLNSNPRLLFGNEEMEVFPQLGMLPNDPRIQMEALGDDNMKANSYGIKNFKRVLSDLHSWNYEENGQYDETAQVYTWLFNQYKKFITQAIAYVGGVQRTYKSETQLGAVYESTPKILQKEAVSFINDELFKTPNWLLNPAILNKISAPVGTNDIAKLQRSTLRQLLDLKTFVRLTKGTTLLRDDSYTPNEYLSDLHKSVWSDINERQLTDVNRRDLHITYLNSVAILLTSLDPNVKETAWWEAIYNDFKRIDKEVKIAAANCPDDTVREHLQSVEFLINKIYKSLQSRNT